MTQFFVTNIFLVQDLLFGRKKEIAFAINYFWTKDETFSLLKSCREAKILEDYWEKKQMTDIYS